MTARIGSDGITLSWIAGLLDAGHVWRLALSARSGIPDADVLAAWHEEAKADKAAAEAEAAAAFKARIATANAAEGNETGELALRPPGF